jgi:archaellum component FlaC
LWEQLAESEKRERVLKQELESQQNQIQTQMRVIDRFKDEMKQVTISNKKLKDSNIDNEKKLKHLQSRMKDIDLYEEVNIPKMI